MSKWKSRKKKEKKRLAKNKLVPMNIVRRCLYIIENLRTIYLDTAILGYKTDADREQRSGKSLLWFVKRHNRTTFISFVDVYEIRPIFRIRKGKESLKKKIIDATEEFSPKVIMEKETLETLRKNRDFLDFLLKLGIEDADAAHFTIALFKKIDLFVSFNKRIFKNKKTRILREVMRRRLKMPVVWCIEDIESNLEEMKKHNF